MSPDICHGKPCIRGMRYPVEMILKLLSAGMTIDEILVEIYRSSGAHRLKKITE
jgi:uncharacterized protein (DUF433 family)